jgi:3-carboxy-cis,cis-muconate cycloisomerase
MGLHTPLFGEPEVDRHLSDESRLQALLDVEVALVEAQADVGLASGAVVEATRAAARAERYDRSALARDAARAGNVVIPIVAQLTRDAAAIEPAAARFVHAGATSQDILDTGLVLQLRAALPALVRQIDRAAGAAAHLAATHRCTPLAGRTWLQQAVPVSFGLKAAGWLDALERGRRGVDAAATAACVLQFGGASGTLASLGASADAVARALAQRLDLPRPDLPWHAHRDRLAQLGCALGVLTGTCGKVAKDLALLAQTEVGEAFEPHAAGRGGSSSMPHKRNPVAAAVALAAAVRVPGLVASMLAAMPQEHERGLGGWQAEWEVVPEIVHLAAGAVRSVADALDGLEVDSGRMAANLEMTGGLILAEAAAAALAPHLGRPGAHALVEAACRRAARERRPLVDVLAEDPDATRLLTRDELAEALRPDAYLGQASSFVERVLARWGRDPGVGQDTP